MYSNHVMFLLFHQQIPTESETIRKDLKSFTFYLSICTRFLSRALDWLVGWLVGGLSFTWICVTCVVDKQKTDNYQSWAYYETAYDRKIADQTFRGQMYFLKLFNFFLYSRMKCYQEKKKELKKNWKNTFFIKKNFFLKI